MLETLFLPAEEKDREPILALSRKIWEGGDYLPNTLNDWLAVEDPFMLLWDNSRENLIGCGHLAFFGSTAWLEGLRIDPSFQGKGYGGLLFREMLRVAFRRKPQRVATLIISDNAASLHLAEKHGFDIVAESFLLEADPLSKPWKKAAEPSPVYPREIGKMRSVFSEFLSASNQYWHDAWLAYPEADYLQDRFLFSYSGGKILAGITGHEPDSFAISAFTRPGEWLAEALEDIRRWASRLGCRVVTLTLPMPMAITLPFIEKQGFHTVSYDDCISATPARLHILEYNPCFHDDAIVQGQLELTAEKMDNFYATAYRCGYGFPAVIECFPLQNGKPFTTSHYLTCPHLRYEISRLEETGEIKRLEPLFNSKAMRLSHETIRRRRMNRLRNLGMEKDLPDNYVEAFSKGIGGIRDIRHGKCLHLHAAVYLAGIANPAGQAVIDRLKANRLTLDCETMRCAAYFE
ncbi:MAG TPA: GNAT family N-acetyltransferase [Thermotogota bacterium]|nr:GNAT family N-acetyltransferase [Thermotogota bacterium]